VERGGERRWKGRGGGAPMNIGEVECCRVERKKRAIHVEEEKMWEERRESIRIDQGVEKKRKNNLAINTWAPNVKVD